MSFLSPVFLWALPAVSVPLILHLLNRRTPRRVPFAYVEWLKAAHQSTMPKRKLNERLLLLVRTMLLLALVLFFARPLLQNGGRLMASGGGHESLVVLLDVSASMQTTVAGRPAIALARERLVNTLRKIPPSVKVGLVTFAAKTQQELAPSDDRSRLLSSIQSADAGLGATDVKPALALAYQMLGHQAGGRKTILVVSDMAEHGWRALKNEPGSIDGFDPAVRVVLWDAVEPAANAGVSRLDLSLSQEGVLKGQALVHMSGNVGPSLVWRFVLNDRVVAQGSLPGNVKSAPLAFSAQLPEGGYYAGTFSLAQDAAPFDDRMFVAGRVPKGFNLLIVDGKGGLTPAETEAYYLRSALESPRDPRVESIRVIRPESFAAEPLSKYGAIVLANVADISLKEGDLTGWVEKGGGLFITAGSKWPRSPFRLTGFFGVKSVSSDPQKAAAPEARAPVLSSLGDLERFEWNQISVATHARLENEASFATLLRLENTDPLLVRKQVGQGFVMGLTTSIDRSWSNLPAKPVFAPLVRELLASLADPYREQSSLAGWVGEPVRVRVPAGVRSVSVVSPTGAASGANVNRDGFMEAPAPTVPGLYHVKTDQAAGDFDFAVNVRDLDKEGDLTRLLEKDVKPIFPNASVTLVNAQTNKTEALLAALQGRELTAPLLAGLFLLFGVETWLGRKKR